MPEHGIHSQTTYRPTLTTRAAYAQRAAHDAYMTVLNTARALRARARSLTIPFHRFWAPPVCLVPYLGRETVRDIWLGGFSLVLARVATYNLCHCLHNPVVRGVLLRRYVTYLQHLYHYLPAPACLYSTGFGELDLAALAITPPPGRTPVSTY